MGALRLTSLLICLALGFSACGGPQRVDQQATAPLGSATPAPPDLAPPPPPQGAFLAQLTPEQTAQLTAFGVEVIVPGVVPPTFAATEIRGKAASSGPDGGAAYSILYKDTNQRCFAVEFASSGIGDPPITEKRLPIKPPLFANKSYGLHYGTYRDPTLQAKFPQPELYTDWLMGKAGAYRLVGASYINSTFPNQGNCQDITPAEAQKIVESLTVIAPAVMGDGQPPQ